MFCRRGCWGWQFLRGGLLQCDLWRHCPYLPFHKLCTDELTEGHWQFCFHFSPSLISPFLQVRLNPQKISWNGNCCVLFRIVHFCRRNSALGACLLKEGLGIFACALKAEKGFSSSSIFLDLSSVFPIRPFSWNSSAIARKESRYRLPRYLQISSLSCRLVGEGACSFQAASGRKDWKQPISPYVLPHADHPRRPEWHRWSHCLLSSSRRHFWCSPESHSTGGTAFLTFWWVDPLNTNSKT